MDTAELDAALIENLADLDAIHTRLQDVGDRLWAFLGREIERWAKEHGWRGEFDPDGDFWVCPPDWGTASDREHRFYFEDGPGEDSRGLSYDLSRWCGAGGGRICLWFEPKLPRSKWKPVARAAAGRLAAAGFQLSDAGNVYSECTPTLAVVAAGFRESDLTPVAAPLLAALDRATKAKPLFDELLKQAIA